MATTSAPRTSVVDPSVTLAWSDGTPFDGWIWVGVVPPTLSGTDFASVAVGNQNIYEQIPPIYYISVKAGVADPTVSVFYTSDLDPPGVQYVTLFYDRTGRKISATYSAQFNVTASTFNPLPPTLTAPIAGSTPPTPN